MTLIQDVLSVEVKKIGDLLGFDIKFKYSTPNEFVSELTELENSSAKGRYPFFFVNSMNVKYGLDGLVTVPEIVVATLSDELWKSTQRDLHNFKPTLYPICDAFINNVRTNKVRNLGLVKQADLLPHYFYGKSGVNGYEGNKFPKSVDAIQLLNYQFRIYTTCKK